MVTHRCETEKMYEACLRWNHTSRTGRWNINDYTVCYDPSRECWGSMGKIFELWLSEPGGVEDTDILARKFKRRILNHCSEVE